MARALSTPGQDSSLVVNVRHELAGQDSTPGQNSAFYTWG